MYTHILIELIHCTSKVGSCPSDDDSVQEMLLSFSAKHLDVAAEKTAGLC